MTIAEIIAQQIHIERKQLETAMVKIRVANVLNKLDLMTNTQLTSYILAKTLVK